MLFTFGRKIYNKLMDIIEAVYAIDESETRNK